MAMRTTRLLAPVLLAAALACGSSALVACGGGDTHTANIKPDDMPEGESWTGVYYHPVYGYLHLVANENNIVGKWKRTDGSAWGQISGVATGNVLHFHWKEHKYGVVGPSAEQSGKGYFQYKMGAEKIAELDGQFGMGSDETGGDWHTVKQVRMTPDLNSIKGDNPGVAQPASKDSWQ
jgi:hypothetical protein